MNEKLQIDYKRDGLRVYGQKAAPKSDPGFVTDHYHLAHPTVFEMSHLGTMGTSPLWLPGQ